MSMIDDNLLRLCTKLWVQVSTFEQPADVLLSKFFRENRKLKAAERNIIAETIFAILRNYHKISRIIDTKQSMRMIVYVWLRIVNISENELTKITIVKSSDVAKLPELDYDILELPDWVVNKLSTYMSSEEIKKLDHAMNLLAPLTLRVNTIKMNRNDLLAKFAEDGIEASETNFSLYGVRLAKKSSLMNNKLFLDGCFEVQDEASQLAGLLLDAKRSEMVVDFCAGSGGKALMIGMMMRNSGRIYAFDVNERRLSNMAPRLARSGLSNIYPQVIANENDTKVKRLMGKIDKVFVDAPCLGFGTLRRNPDLKFRQSESSLLEINEKQLSILNSASRLVKDGGIIIYATCSILREENRDIVKKFLNEHDDFEIVNLEHIVSNYGLELSDYNYLELFPHIHDTDGFFACVLRKKVV